MIPILSKIDFLEIKSIKDKNKLNKDILSAYKKLIEFFDNGRYVLFVKCCTLVESSKKNIEEYNKKLINISEFETYLKESKEYQERISSCIEKLMHLISIPEVEIKDMDILEEIIRLKQFFDSTSTNTKP